MEGAAVSPEPSAAWRGRGERPDPTRGGSERPEPTRGWCEREVEEELPGLHLVHTRSAVDRSRRSSPPAVKRRLAALSNRWAGAHAVGLRQRPVPAAYRVFFRHIGLDPDVVRTPIEEAMLARMMQGGFHSNHLLADALLITLVDTGVPVWAFDAATIEDPLGIRSSREGELFGGPLPPSARSPARPSNGPLLPAGHLVVADARAAVAVLFGEIAPGHAAGAGAGEVALFTLQVPGVPSLHVEEALWMCAAMLEGPW
jgi:DNA/RNA-binding domain of Phe-tRNA-synthetase-like protein